MSIRIDVWSDVVCPWCYIGKRRLETALTGLDDEYTVNWHSFQLDPTIPLGHREPVQQMLAKKIGAPVAQVKGMTSQVTELAAAEGLTYDLDHAISVNTRDAHRIAHLADEHGLGDAMHERLLKAHLCETAVVDDTETLVRLATEVGVPEAEAGDVLNGTKYAAEVEADVRRARQIGVSGVPFFVINEKYALSGAQPATTFQAALRKVQAEP